MRALNWALAMTVALGVSACDKKKNKSKDADGNCTSLFINQYNEVKLSLTTISWSCDSSISSISTLNCETKLQEALNRCTSFTSTHPAGRSCKASRMGQEINASAGEIHSDCASLQSKANSYQSGATERQRAEAARRKEETDRLAREAVERTKDLDRLRKEREEARDFGGLSTSGLAMALPSCEEAKASDLARKNAARKIEKEKSRIDREMAQDRAELEELNRQQQLGLVSRTNASTRSGTIIDRLNQNLSAFDKVTTLEMCLRESQN